MAAAIALYGASSGAALAIVVGVLVEVLVMLSVCASCNRTRHWFPERSPIEVVKGQNLGESIPPSAYEREIPAEAIGMLVMRELRALDQVAYVRFASVYRRFQEATDFVHEVKKLGSKT